MIHTLMEVDFHPSVSPSKVCGRSGSPFGTLRHSKQNRMSKRERSPEEVDADAGAGRPLKRAAFRHLQLSTVSSGNSSRQNSEDWVQQAGGLRIDSPVVPPSEGPYYLAGNAEAIGVAGPGPSTLANMDEDIDMAEEPESILPMDSTSPNQSNATPVYDSSDPFLQQLEKRRLLMLNTSRHPYGEWARSSRVANSSGPMINIVPATPAHSQQSLTLRETPARNVSPSTTSHIGQTRVMLQAQGERVATPPPPPDDSGAAFQQEHAANYQVGGPKRRITFGPRLDCEKCQKGEIHFTHFDYR